jgi:hypothetical protein
MKCEELLAGLNDLVDGEQATALCQALREHLVHCNPCQIVVDNIRQTITLYRGGETVPLPAELHERLREALHARWAAKFSRPAAS